MPAGFCSSIAKAQRTCLSPWYVLRNCCRVPLAGFPPLKLSVGSRTSHAGCAVLHLTSFRAHLTIPPTFFFLSFRYFRSFSLAYGHTLQTTQFATLLVVPFFVRIGSGRKDKTLSSYRTNLNLAPSRSSRAAQLFPFLRTNARGLHRCFPVVRSHNHTGSFRLAAQPLFFCAARC